MNILFYGASVTAQSNGNGYIDWLKSDDNLKKLNFSVDKLAFPGSNFNLAALAFINDVIKREPAICFLEWATRPGIDRKKIGIINQVLLSNGILPIWLVLPLFNQNSEYVNRCLDISSQCNEDGVSVLNASSILGDIKEKRNEWFRDNVHTKPEGGRKYAEVISKFLISNINGLQPMIKKAVKPLTGPAVHSFPSLSIGAGYKLSFYLTRLAIGKISKLIAQLVVGPATPLMEVSLTSKCGRHSEKFAIDTSDRWSYYERLFLVPIATWTPRYDTYEITVCVSSVKAIRDASLSEKISSELLTKAPLLEIHKVVATRGSLTKVTIL